MNPDPLGLRRVDATPAAALIAAEIARSGPITFHRFMELALYDPQLGYYAGGSSGPGLSRDYVTSPELHGAFGGLLCAQIVQLWELLGEPDRFWLVEAGPGTGALAADLLMVAATAFPRFAACLRLALIERSPTFRSRQERLLAPWSERVTWLDADPRTWPRLGEGCVLANELLDAFPVHRLVGRGAGIRECFVTIKRNSLVEVEGPLSTSLLVQQIEAGGGSLCDGCYGEVSVEAPAWLGASERLLSRGYWLVIDYGDGADGLYGPKHQQGTLRGYRGQALMRDPLALPGSQDLTAHVDLSALQRAAAEAGLMVIGMTNQAAFLERLGLSQLIEQVEVQVEGRSAQRAHRVALETLRDPAALGNLAVLLVGKNIPTNLPVGLGGSGSVGLPDVSAVWRLSGR